MDIIQIFELSHTYLLYCLNQYGFKLGTVVKRYKKYCISMSMILNTAWKDFLKKKASGIDCDLGEVQQVHAELIVTEKGIINKKKYCIPKNLIAGFDGHTLFFRIVKTESKRYRQDNMKLRKVTKKITKKISQ